MHKYDDIVKHLHAALRELDRLGLGGSLAKGRIGEILLAHRLGHEIQLSGAGADGIGADGKKYEYKVSADNQFNFNFGHAGKDANDAEKMVRKHFEGYEGAYCALTRVDEIVSVAYCPVSVLVPLLAAHMSSVSGSTWQKVFSPIGKFAEISGASWIQPRE